MEPVLGSEISRARRRLWTLTFTVLALLSVVLIYVSTVDTGTMHAFDLLPSRRLLAIGLVGALAVFCLYVMDAERKLRALSERLLEERLATERLEAEQAEQRDFVSMAAHELRTPLTAIKGFTRTLIARFDQLEHSRRIEYLSLVNEQSDRLARLVDDLMEVTRIDAGRVRLQRAPVELPRLIWDVVEQFDAKWGDRVDVRVDGSPSPALADGHKLEEVIINLVDNAVKYSPAGERVVVTIRTVDAEVEVAIRDHGDGMKQEEADGLFAKFHRLPQALASDVPGTGLGLYIVRGLVEAHGGRVWVESAPGEGSTFFFRLPSAGADTSVSPLGVAL